jgi:hypothetical protein
MRNEYTPLTVDDSGSGSVWLCFGIPHMHLHMQVTKACWIIAQGHALSTHSHHLSQRQPALERGQPMTCLPGGAW